MEVGRLSVPPALRLWQELQEMNPDFDRRGSKNSCLPSSTLAGASLGAASSGWMGSLAAQAWPASSRPAVSRREWWRIIGILVR